MASRGVSSEVGFVQGKETNVHYFVEYNRSKSVLKMM